MKKSTILLMSCLFLLINNIKSQIWTNYTTVDGLASNTVSSVAIDVQGNKWFGTVKGVSKFDGTTWTTYNTANGQLTNDIVSDIAIDKQGHIVIGTTSGFSEFDGTTWKTYTTEKDGMPCDYIHSIAIDTLNNKWFAAECEGSGVVKFDGTTWSNYSAVEGLPWIEVWSIAIDSQGNKWFSCNFCDGDMFLEPYIPNYLLKFDDITWTKYTTNELLCNWIYDLAIDAQGNKWLVAGGGVFKFDGENWTKYTIANGFPENGVSTITLDDFGNIWIGTESGIAKFDGTTWTNYFNSFGWEQNYIYDIAIDNQGNKWFGTFGGVLKLSDATTEITPTTNENLVNLYPNPVQDVLHINLSGKAGELQVFDIFGECLLQKQITENENSVDVSCLGSGIYFVRVMYGKQIFTERIVKY
jgi:ligand-binding sensor domain-containing protein